MPFTQYLAFEKDSSGDSNAPGDSKKTLAARTCGACQNLRSGDFYDIRRSPDSTVTLGCQSPGKCSTAGAGSLARTVTPEKCIHAEIPGT